jgi:hypothetical protein
MDSATTTVILELKLDEGRLDGRVTNVHGTRSEFDGWLGLIRAIDGMFGTDAPATVAGDGLAPTHRQETTSAHH